RPVRPARRGGAADHIVDTRHRRGDPGRDRAAAESRTGASRAHRGGLMLAEDVYQELDRRLADTDAMLRRTYPGELEGRQPVHTVYVPADRFRADLVAD